MAKIERTITGDFDSVLSSINKAVLNSGVSMNLVDSSKKEMGNSKLAVLVYDKYFMRNGSRASLNVTIMSEDREVFVSAIGSGGGQGVFFNFSWGAETDILQPVKQVLDAYDGLYR